MFILKIEGVVSWISLIALAIQNYLINDGSPIFSYVYLMSMDNVPLMDRNGFFICTYIVAIWPHVFDFNIINIGILQNKDIEMFCQIEKAEGKPSIM